MWLAVQPRSHILVTVYFLHTYIWQMINLNTPAYFSGRLTPLNLEKHHYYLTRAVELGFKNLKIKVKSPI